MTTLDPTATVTQVVSSLSEIATTDEEIIRGEKYLRRIQTLLMASDGKTGEEIEGYRERLRQHRAAQEDNLNKLRAHRASLGNFISESGFGSL